MLWCVGFPGMLPSFVTTLQDDYKDSRNCDVMCWFSGMLPSFVTTLQDDYKDSSNCMLPKRRFWMAERTFGNAFTLQMVSTRFGLLSFEKYYENAFPNVRSDFRNLRLGSIQLWCDVLVLWDATMFCNNLTRWLQNQHVMCWFSGMLLSFVTTLQLKL